MTLREMISYTLYYRDIAYYWRFVRFDVEYQGHIQTVLHLPRHELNTIKFSTN